MSRATLKAIQAAAGNAGEGLVYVDDVFSTYLYEGTNATQTINNGIKLGNNFAGPSVRFNNTSDYLNGTLSGGSDTKTITFSGWFYKPSNDTNTPFSIYNNSGNLRFYFQLDGGTADTFQFVGYNSSGTQIFRVTSNTTALAANNWYHIMLSVDLANSSNRHLYLNDVAVSSPNWNTYTNDNLALSEQDTFVGTFNSSQTDGVQTYISNLYLDYTYRDLSVESNRRLFITSDDTPATGQASLNPILYLPLDSASFGSNSGTGGDLSTVGSPYYDEDFGPYIGTGGEGGLVWTKRRTDVADHNLYDTERGADKALESNTADAEHTGGAGVIQFNSSGFNLGTGSRANANGQDYASWTFRKQPGFFDVVTYTGNGTAGRTVSHNLGSVPGMIIVKRLNSTGEWAVYHSGSSANPEQNYLWLNTTDSVRSSIAYWNDTAPTDSEFSVGTNYQVNSSGSEYVAYLFAHDAQDFGTDSDESIIKCGSYTGTGSAGNSINLGFEPQWLMIKQTSGANDWYMYDTMRGIATGGNDAVGLKANSSDAEGSSNHLSVTSTGFELDGSGGGYNGSGATYIYIAIRRPHKPAEELTANDVFSVKTYAATTTSASVTHDVVFDAEINANRDVGTSKFHFVDQLRGINGVTLRSSNTSQELSYPTFWSRQNMYTMYAPSQFDSWWASSSGTQNHISYALKRAPGFFDIVAYTGTGSTLVLDHNLGVEPEFMIVKGRTITAGWHCYHKDVGNTKAVPLNSDGAESTSSFYWNNTSPTATQATLGAFTHYNVSNQTGILYLFATVAGISKVGSYSGTGSDVNVDCGFSSGARMVWVKRADSSGDWFVWDSVRGIVAGNDPYLRLNSETAEVTTTDYIDPLSSGFTITSSAPAALNTSGGTYIFLAIA